MSIMGGPAREALEEIRALGFTVDYVGRDYIISVEGREVYRERDSMRAIGYAHTVVLRKLRAEMPELEQIGREMGDRLFAVRGNELRSATPARRPLAQIRPEGGSRHADPQNEKHEETPPQWRGALDLAVLVLISAMFLKLSPVVLLA
jgi:hypothetical protein